MTNQEYLRGNFFGTGLPVHSIRSHAHNVPRRIQYETGDFSSLLNLYELQRPQEPAIEERKDEEFSIFENRQPFNEEIQHANLDAEFSLEEFERDMDLLAAGLEHLPSQYRGNYSREDIYLDDE